MFSMRVRQIDFVVPAFAGTTTEVNHDPLQPDTSE